MILEAITVIIEKRKAEKRIPHSAMLQDVAAATGLTESEVEEEALKLKEEGVIAIKDTINSISFYLQ